MLWVSGMDSRKGPMLAVRALATTPDDVRLVMVGDGLFFGALFFTFCFRRAEAIEWRTAWQHIEGTPLRLGAVLVLFAGAWAVYGRRGRSLVSALLGTAAAAVLMTFVSQTGALRAREAGLTVVMNRCVMVDHRRLLGG